MSQFTTQSIRRTGGEVNVYTGMLFVAFLVMMAGVVLMGLRNIEHSGGGKEGGGIIKLID